MPIMTILRLRKLNSRDLSWPADWPELFGANRPLILEIGFGYGDFILHLARQNPDCNIIGLEISNRCLTKVESRVERHGLNNVRLIHTPAETALHHLFEPASLREVYINFPDPWFKSRHAGRRLMQRDTIDALVSRLQTEGRLYLATDILEYAEMSHELLADTPGLDNALDRPWMNTPLPGRVITKYERAAQQEGRECYYFAYRRNTVLAPFIPVIKELTMPHVVLHTPLSLEAMRATFRPLDATIGDTHIHAGLVYIGNRSLLFDVYVKEPTIDQRVALVLVEREAPQEFTLQLSVIGHPRPTAGIHTATNLLADWLLSLHPEAKVLKRKTQQAE
jgi:tRNA (guanine-N7-)-methyltransferase